MCGLAWGLMEQNQLKCQSLEKNMWLRNPGKSGPKSPRGCLQAPSAENL